MTACAFLGMSDKITPPPTFTPLSCVRMPTCFGTFRANYMVWMHLPTHNNPFVLCRPIFHILCNIVLDMASLKVLLSNNFVFILLDNLFFNTSSCLPHLLFIWTCYRLLYLHWGQTLDLLYLTLNTYSLLAVWTW